MNHTQEYGHASTAEVVEQLESMLAEARIEAELNRKGEYVNEVTAGREMASVIYRFTLDEAVSA